MNVHCLERIYPRRLKKDITTWPSGLERIGKKIGFKAQIKIDGLPTLADVETASHNLSSGAMPFTEVMKTFKL